MKALCTQTDYFAEIATARVEAQREGLEFPAAPVVPDAALPWTDAPKPRQRAPRLTTVEEMHEALEALRHEYAPYMEDLAPLLPVTRDALEFTSFQWKVETSAERGGGFGEVLDGLGAWGKVVLPHYGPPLGKAATLYRCVFQSPDWAATRDVLQLQFGGVDYRCQVYLNGQCVGTHEGFFERFSMDCTDAIKSGENILLVRVENDYTMLGENMGPLKPDGDKIYAATGLGYDEPMHGWHHCPAAMGIWNYVRLVGAARLFIEDLWVRPLLESGEVEIHAEVESRSPDPEEDVTLSVSVFGQNFETVVHRDHLHKGEATFVRGFGDLLHGFDERAPLLMGSGRNYLRFRLPIPDARTWSPRSPWLYQVQARLLDAKGTLLDARKAQFGMRSFVQDETSTPKGKFFLNGKQVRLRGANTMGNFERRIMLGDSDGLRDQILLAKLTNMNFLRMTQRPVHDEFYDYCDRLGMMIQTDLPLFSTIRRTQFNEVARQAGCMERHVRGHCCNIIVSFINEPRPAAGMKPHRFLYREEMECLFDICASTVRYHNPDRVVKYVDGDYDPPASQGMSDNHVYCGWYLGHGIDLGALHQGQWLPVKPGWHFGCGEFGSEGLDSYEVMVKHYPAAWKPSAPDAPWSPEPIAMSQTFKYHYLWYDSASTARGWIEASQGFQAWVTELQTQAYRRMIGMNTFAIHLFIDAWPAGWMKTIMDVSCAPKKAWFAYRDALAPLAVSLRSDRTQLFSGEQISVELWICNDHPEMISGLRVEYEVTLDGRLLASGKHSVQAPACAPACQGFLPLVVPAVAARGRLEIGVTLIDASGEPIHGHELAFSVFPSAPVLSGRVWCPGADAAVRRFVTRLGAKPVESASEAAVVLVANSQVLQENLAHITAAVRAGAVAVLLELTSGEYELGCSRLSVRTAGMGPRHFVSRATGHPLVEGFEANDFRFWFHESLGRCAPILHTVLDVNEAWSPILQSGDGGWTKPWARHPAAVEARDGKGLWRVCQVNLPDCISANAVARTFAVRLLSAI